MQRILMGSVLVAAIGCPAGEVETIGDHGEELYVLSTALWPDGDIPVCWTKTGNSTEKGWV